MRAQRRMARVGVILGIAVCGFVPTSLSQECPEYVDRLSVNRWPSSPSQIEISGSYAFVASDDSVAIVDIADPAGPRVVGEVGVRGGYKSPNSLIDFETSGNRLFLLANVCHRRGCWRALLIADVSDPKRPEWLLSDYFDIDWKSEKIAAFGDTVVIASSDGVIVLDVTDPSKPLEVGYFDSPWVGHSAPQEYKKPSGLVVADGMAVVMTWIRDANGFWFIDVSNPTNPVEVGFWQGYWRAVDLGVSDGFAYVADRSYLKIFDITNPLERVEVGTLEIEHEAVSVSVAGNYAAVGLANQGVAIVDVTDKSDPVIVGFYPSEEAAPDVALVGSTVFALADGFRVLDLSFWDSPLELSSFSFESSSMDVEISDGVMYVATGDSGLYVRDESNPGGVVESFLDTPGYALGVTLHDDLALVADGAKGVRIIDVSDSKDLAEIGFVDTPGEARRVAVAGDYAYVADRDGGLRIIDISTPEEPIEVGGQNTPEPAVDVVVEGNFAYVADGHLRIFEVSDPAHPIAVPYTASPGFALAIKDDVLYLAGASLLLFSLSYPDRPQLLSTARPFSWSREPTGISLSGDHAYVTTRWVSPRGKEAGRFWITRSGVEVFEIDQLRFPYWVGGWEEVPWHAFWAAAVSDGQLHLASGESDIYVLDNRCLTTYWLEVATHENGFSGSRWRSDVFVSHEADSSVDFDFVLHTGEGEFTAAASVDSGHQGVFEDIVDLLGHRGTGALEIRATNPLTVTSRVYSESDSGTYGAFLQAHRSSDCIGSGKLYGLRQVTGEFRTNINVTNTTDEMHEVWITLYRTDGQELARYSVEVEPGMVVQDLQPFKNRAGKPNLGWGYARVQGGKGILAFASVTDSRTNDALIVPLVR